MFDDADIPAAAEAIAVAGYFNSGQDCTAATRVLVHSSIRQDFVDALSAQAREAKVGTPFEADVLCGPLNNSNQLSHVLGFLDRVPSHASVTAGGEQVGSSGYFVAPTVIAGLQQDDEMSQREVFGPVITVQDSQTKAKRWATQTALSTGLPRAYGPSMWPEQCDVPETLILVASG